MSLFSLRGSEFFPLGGQAHNSSAYNAEELASAIAGVKAIGGNTLEAPVYWEQVEPREGHFDFASVDSLLRSCRDAGLALVVLWFATWKNGEMRYVPEWVKRDRRRFARVVGFDGTELPVLSSYCAASRQADARAFRALMSRLASLDKARDTLLAVQVENEPGILGSDRDYGAPAVAAAREAVPAALTDYLDRTRSGPVHDEWRERGARRGAPWTETFGLRAHEYREAWSIARYIDEVARAGREAMDVPLYANAWLSQDGLPVPGSYPAGGPVWRTLEIWKAAAPTLAVIAPDIYVANQASYREVCAQYRRADNPLFVPESGVNEANAMNMLRAVAQFDAEGYACFGVDGVLDLQGRLRPEAELFAQSFAAVTAMAPLLRKHRGTGRARAVVTEENKAAQAFELERYFGLVPLAGAGSRTFHKDHRHARSGEPRPEHPVFGLIVEAGPHELYLAGHFHLRLVPASAPDWCAALRSEGLATPPDYLSVEEGSLSPSGEFVPSRRRNGDEVVFGHFWSSPSTGVTRVRLEPPG